MCDLEWYQEYQGEIFDFRNILPYAVLYGMFQLTAFLSVFFEDLAPIARFIRNLY